MATIGSYQPIIPFDPIVHERGTQSYPEAASLTIKRGTPVIKDSAGRIDAAGATPSVIFGISAEAGHNGTAGQYNIIVWPLTAGSLWYITNVDAIVQTDITNAKGIVKDSTTGYWGLVESDSGDQFTVVNWEGPPAGPNIGDTLSYVLARPVPSKIQGV